MSFLQTSDNFWSNRIKLKKKWNGLSYRTYIKYAGRGKWRGGGGIGGFYKFFRKEFVTQEIMDLNPSNFFRKYFMVPPINFSFLFKAYL